METIGKRISENRRRLALTQEGLAEKLGVTAQAVSKWECDASCPDITLLPLIAEIFSITTDELLTGKAPRTVKYQKAGEGKPCREMSIRITVYSGDDTVKVNVPMPIAEAAVRAGLDIAAVYGKASMSNVNLEEVIQLVRDGAVGELMTVETDDGDRIVISAR